MPQPILPPDQRVLAFKNSKINMVNCCLLYSIPDKGTADLVSLTQAGQARSVAAIYYAFEAQESMTVGLSSMRPAEPLFHRVLTNRVDDFTEVWHVACEFCQLHVPAAVVSVSALERTKIKIDCNHVQQLVSGDTRSSTRASPSYENTCLFTSTNAVR